MSPPEGTWFSPPSSATQLVCPSTACRAGGVLHARSGVSSFVDSHAIVRGGARFGVTGFAGGLLAKSGRMGGATGKSLTSKSYAGQRVNPAKKSTKAQ